MYTLGLGVVRLPCELCILKAVCCLRTVKQKHAVIVHIADRIFAVREDGLVGIRNAPPAVLEHSSNGPDVLGQQLTARATATAQQQQQHSKHITAQSDELHADQIELSKLGDFLSAPQHRIMNMTLTC